jgi:adenylyltransferase/sulfurtransferase
MQDVGPVTLNEGRFARLEAIAWWNQSVLRDARVLVVGAGALGNEVIKNLALLGAGTVVVVDMDRIEKSNLSRSVLFRERDEGASKAECAARAAAELYPAMRVVPIVGNVMADVGLGYFRWAQVVVGAVDNREARVFVNAACAKTGRPWIDGGIEVLRGVVRGFAPPGTACYECTMGRVDWELLDARRSCSLLAQRAAQERGTPTTPTTASVVGAIQTQEVVKLLHGMDALLGRGVVFDGETHQSYALEYPTSPACGWHEGRPEVARESACGSDAPLRHAWTIASERLGGLDAIDFGRDIVELIARKEDVLLPVQRVREDQIICRGCGAEASPQYLSSIGENSPLLAKTAREVGLPAWDILWARRGERCLGIELAGDDPFSDG